MSSKKKPEPPDAGMKKVIRTTVQGGPPDAGMPGLPREYTAMVNDAVADIYGRPVIYDHPDDREDAPQPVRADRPAAFAQIRANPGMSLSRGGARSASYTHVPAGGEVLPSSEADAAEDVADIRGQFLVERLPGMTVVTAVAVDTVDPGANQVIAVRCVGGRAVGGFLYDHNQDAYLVDGVEVIDVGRVGFRCQVSIPGTSEWSHFAPIPPKVVDKRLGAAERRAFAAFRDKYPTPRYAIRYLQLVSG